MGVPDRAPQLGAYARCRGAGEGGREGVQGRRRRHARGLRLRLRLRLQLRLHHRRSRTCLSAHKSQPHKTSCHHSHAPCASDSGHQRGVRGISSSNAPVPRPAPAHRNLPATTWHPQRVRGPALPLPLHDACCGRVSAAASGGPPAMSACLAPAGQLGEGSAARRTAARQTGQREAARTHRTAQGQWKRCAQGRRARRSPARKSSRHTAHSSSSCC